MSSLITRFYSLIIILAAGAAYIFPEVFIRPAPYIPLMLGIVMLGMGLTLTKQDLADIAGKPIHVLIGSALHYTIMPALGFITAKLFGCGDETAAGFILLGCVPAGTASNVLTYLAKGDVALSVAISSVTTVISPLATPLIFLLLAGSCIHVSTAAVFADIVKIVLVPTLAGFLLRYFFDRKIEKVIRLVPAVSVLTIVLIISAIVAGSAPKLLQSAGRISAGVVFLNMAGLASAFAVSRLLMRLSPAKSTSIMFDVGVQNSGLGASLAMLHLSAFAALPCAVYSVWQNISVSLIANLCVRMKRK